MKTQLMMELMESKLGTCIYAENIVMYRCMYKVLLLSHDIITVVSLHVR